MKNKNFAPIGIRKIKYYPKHIKSNGLVFTRSGVATFYLFDNSTDKSFVNASDKVYNKFLKLLDKKKINYEIEDMLYE